MIRSPSLVPSSSPATSCTEDPSIRNTPPSGNVPARTFGPGRSASTATGRPTRSLDARTCRNRSRCSSSVPWLRLRRTTSTPARSSASSTSGASLAGPSVADDLRSTAHGCYLVTRGAAPDPTRAARATGGERRPRRPRALRGRATRRPSTSPPTCRARRSTPSTPARCAAPSRPPRRWPRRSGRRSSSSPTSPSATATPTSTSPSRSCGDTNDPRWQSMLDGVWTSSTKRRNCSRRRVIDAVERIIAAHPGRARRRRVPRRRDQTLHRARARAPGERAGFFYPNYTSIHRIAASRNGPALDRDAERDRPPARHRPADRAVPVVSRRQMAAVTAPALRPAELPRLAAPHRSTPRPTAPSLLDAAGFARRRRDRRVGRRAAAATSCAAARWSPGTCRTRPGRARRSASSGAHTDSPGLRVKPDPDAGQLGWKQLAVEVYGGVLAQLLARPRPRRRRAGDDARRRHPAGGGPRADRPRAAARHPPRSRRQRQGPAARPSGAPDARLGHRLAGDRRVRRVAGDDGRPVRR